MKPKRLLSVLLVGAITLGILANTFLVGFADGENPLWQIDAGLVTTVNGDASTGFSFEGHDQGTATYLEKIENVDRLKMSFHFDADAGQNGLISFYVGDGANKHSPDKQSMLENQRFDLLLHVAEADGQKKLKVNLWDGTDVQLYDGEYLPTDFNGIHTLEFVSFLGHWYVAVDGVIMTKANIDELYTNAHEKPLNVRFSGSSVFAFGSLKFEEKSTEWNVAQETALAENSAGKFTVLGRHGGDGYAFSAQTQDLDKTVLSFQSTFESGWNYLGLSGSPDFASFGKLDKRTVPLIMTREGENLKIAFFNDDNTEKLIVKLDRFDFSKTHTYGFDYRVSEDKWYLTVDKASYFEENMSNRLKSLDTQQVYYRVGAGIGGNLALISDLSIDEKPVISDQWEARGIIVTGNEDDGFTVTGNQYVRGAYQKPLNLDRQQLTFQLDSIGSWVYIGFASSTDDYGSDSVSTDGRCGFLFEKLNNGQMKAQFHKADDSWDYSIMGPMDFDWSKPHTLGFSKGASCGKADHADCWYVTLDGTVYDGKSCLTDYIGSILGEAYLHMGFNNGGVISEIKVVDKEIVEPDPAEKDWVRNGIEVSGNAEDGYTVTGDGYVRGSYKTPVNLETQQVSFHSDSLNENDWLYMGFAKDTEDYALDTMNQPGRCGFLLEKMENGTKLKLSFHKQNEKPGDWNYDVIGMIDFDWSKPHAIGFAKGDDCGNASHSECWYLMLDGRVYTSKMCFGEYVASMASEAYLKLGFHYGGAISELRIEEKPENPSPATDKAFFTENMDQSGNNAIGFTLNGEGSALYRSSVEITTLSLNMQFKPEQGQWYYLSFHNSDLIQNKFLTPEKVRQLDAAEFILGVEDSGSFRFSLWDNVNGKEVALAYIDDFDWNVPHTFQIRRFNKDWYFTVDGKKCGLRNLNSQVEALLGKAAYVTLSSSSGANATFTNLQFNRNVITEYWNAADIQVSGSPETGFSLNGYGTANYLTPFHLSAQEVQMQIIPAEEHWGYLRFSNTADDIDKLFDEDVREKYNAVAFILWLKNDRTLAISRWDTVNHVEIPLLRLDNFNRDIPHTYGVAQTKDGWFFAVDGKIYDSVDLSAQITPLLSEDCYVSIGSDGTDAGIASSQVKIQNHAKTPDYAYDWIVTPGFKADGENHSVYELNGLGTAIYRNEFDIRTDKISFQVNPAAGSWVYVSLSSSKKDIGKLLSTETRKQYSAIEFIFGKQDNGSLRLSYWDTEKKAETAISYVGGFDWDKTHTMSFFLWRGKWYVTLDNTTFAATPITDQVGGLVGKDAYIRLGSDGTTPITFRNVRLNQANPLNHKTGEEGSMALPALILAGACMCACLWNRKEKQRLEVEDE